MQKYIIGVAAIIVLGVLGNYVLKSNRDTLSPSTTTGDHVGQMATSTYATSTFSVVYPSDYTADTSYEYDQVNPKKPIHGVKFTIPGTMATGTNLAADTYISIEQLPRAKQCTGDIYLHDNVKAASMTDNLPAQAGGVEYSVATSSSSGAGNLYEEQVFALSGTSPCTAVRYFIHSSNIENYTPGTVQEFDRTALTNAFDTIRRSLMLGSAPAVAPTTTP